MYVGTDQSNTKYNMKYNAVGIDNLRGKLCRFAQVNYNLTSQIAIIITGLQTPKITCNV